DVGDGLHISSAASQTRSMPTAAIHSSPRELGSTARPISGFPKASEEPAMFTDDPVTPARLETLVELIRRNPRRQFKREQLIALLQPDGLPDLTPQSKQANEVLKAGHELGLLATDDGVVGATFDKHDERSTERIVLDALDERVLARQDIEPNF